MLVIEGPGGNGIGRRMAPLLGAEFAKAGHAVFPDGESEIRVGFPVRGKDVLLEQSMYPLQDKRIFELLVLADEVRRQGARSIGAVVPYLAYAREDRRIEEKGNAVSIDTLLGLMNSVGITSLVSVAPHNAESLSHFKGVVKVVDAMPAMAESVRGAFRDPFVIAPDEGAMEMAGAFAGVLGCGHTHLSKQRDVLTGEVSLVKGTDEDLAGKDVILVDDMISGGGTMAQASRLAIAKGAGSVTAVAVHLVMQEGACGRLKEAGVSEVYGANTVPCSDARVIDISKAIADRIRGPA